MLSIHITLKIAFIVYFLFILLLVFTKRHIFTKHAALFFYILVFLYQMTWILQGLDITDEGFNLTKAWFMLHGLWKENLDAIAGSSLFGGMWLSIFSKPYILWARLGAAMLIAAIFLLVFKILTLYFDKLKSFVFVFVACIYSTSPTLSCTTVNYNNFPILLALFSIFILFKLNDKNKKIYSILVGLILVFAVFSRLMFAPFIFIPIFYFIFNKKENFLFSKSNNFFYLLGLLIGFGLIFTLLITTYSLNDYVSNVKINFGSSGNSHADKSHTLSYLANLYLNDFWSIIKKTVLVFVLALFIAFWSNIRIKKILKIGIYFCFVYLIFYLIQNQTKFNFHWWKHYIIANIVTNTIIILIANKLQLKEKMLLIIGFLLIFFSFIGSNNSVLVAIYSGSSSLMFAGTLLFLDKSEFIFKKIKFTLKPFVYVSLLSILIFILVNKNNDVYRDKPRKELNINFNSPQLFAITSSSSRVGCVDSLLQYFKSNDFGNKTLLSVNSNPMIYFLVNKPYYLSNPWFVTIEEFENRIKENTLPDIVVFATKNPRNRNWPQTTDTCIAFDKPIFDYFKEFVEKDFYKCTYKNSMFEVYCK